MSKHTHIGTVATKVYTEEGNTIVRYHNTPVFTFNCDVIVLNHGGWKTVTTKRRINQAADQFDLPIRVFQKEYDWFVRIGTGEPVAWGHNEEFIIDRKLNNI